MLLLSREPITNEPESTASGLSVDVLILTEGNFSIELSSARVPLSDNVINDFFWSNI